MTRGVDRARRLERHDELGSLRVEPSELRLRDGAIDRIAQQLMTEVVIALVDVLERVQDRRVDELVKRRLELGRSADRPSPRSRPG
jgi:hypothetical protein